MPKQPSRAEVNTFIQGLITEASPLNFPSNASRDEENFELNRDGTRDRRLGIDAEPDNILVPIPVTLATATQSGFNTFKWYSVNGLEGRDFLAVQTGNTVLFFNLNTYSISSAGYEGQIAISSFAATDKFSFTALEGKLVVVSGAETIAVISYEPSTSTFTVTYQRLLVRDLWGVEELNSTAETDSQYRPASLDPKHLYNLYNQSWGIPRKNKSGTLADPTQIYWADKTKLPSNSEMVWTGLQYQAVVSGADPYERIYPNLYDDSLGLSAQAAKGYFVIDLLRRGESRTAKIAANASKYSQMYLTSFSTVADRSTKGASIVAEFAGRVFYAGFNGDLVEGDKRSPNLTNHVFFSKLVKNLSDINLCYQSGDPTARDDSDLVDTDGGYLRVSGAENLISMHNIGSHLIVLATNGVWAISGGSDYGFNATNYKCVKISTYGCSAPNSTVEEGGRVFFWSDDGIYAVSKDQYGDLNVTSITAGTIQTFYENIPSDAKAGVIGEYDTYSKKIRWMYRVGDYFDTNAEIRELILDTTLNAFYKHRIYTVPNVDVVGIFCGDPITKSVIRDKGMSSIRYLTITKDTTDVYITFCYHNNTQFRDFKSFNGVGVDAKAYLMTGAITGGDSAVFKQVPYIITHFRRTEDGVTAMTPNRQSSCWVRTMWDWADSVVSHKWSVLFQAYRYIRPRFVSSSLDTYDTGFETIVTKNKIRGRGRAFSIYMETEPDKDCRILGWNITMNGNGTV